MLTNAHWIAALVRNRPGISLEQQRKVSWRSGNNVDRACKRLVQAGQFARLRQLFTIDGLRDEEPKQTILAPRTGVERSSSGL